MRRRELRRLFPTLAGATTVEEIDALVARWAKLSGAPVAGGDIGRFQEWCELQGYSGLLDLLVSAEDMRDVLAGEDWKVFRMGL